MSRVEEEGEEMFSATTSFRPVTSKGLRHTAHTPVPLPVRLVN